ncbi:hypothetical protein NBRC110019_14090 [Neptunitalea chrysea]|uniref:STAS/SEC14 domain-containing protein n=1 Tax=Neptunitalea chrysea TaxID=1647581 RepID=A0A9W6EUA6_9FLAO|nr:STAS/SEC14 domain-containing protein [Neptunitalea chrysea]GLB52369.1 hypothetical protein NBRC110019_14090 [Neptunitalea chrysea]
MLSTISNLQVKAKYTLEFGTLYIYDYFVVAILNEGIMLNKDVCLKEMLHFKKHFGDDIPFAYITIRKNSYSVDPTAYFTLRKAKNLKAFAIVSKKEIDFYNYKIEKSFFKQGNMKIFYETKSALKWVNKIMRIEM